MSVNGWYLEAPVNGWYLTRKSITIKDKKHFRVKKCIWILIPTLDFIVEFKGFKPLLTFILRKLSLSVDIWTWSNYHWPLEVLIRPSPLWPNDFVGPSNGLDGPCGNNNPKSVSTELVVWVVPSTTYQFSFPYNF